MTREEELLRTHERVRHAKHQLEGKIRTIMQGREAVPCAGCGRMKDVPPWICEYYTDGRHRYSRMAAIDRVLRTHGVEFVPAGHNRRSPAIVYCNTGDAYGLTVLKVNGRFRVGTLGDLVERGAYD